jgi:hypothetical protein
MACRSAGISCVSLQNGTPLISTGTQHPNSRRGAVEYLLLPHILDSGIKEAPNLVIGIIPYASLRMATFGNSGNMAGRIVI